MKLWNYFKETSKEFYLEECGIDDFSNFPFYDYTVFQDFVIHWICEGKGYLEVDGQSYSLEKNDGFILKKDKKYVIGPIKKILGLPIGWDFLVKN